MNLYNNIGMPTAGSTHATTRMAASVSQDPKATVISGENTEVDTTSLKTNTASTMQDQFKGYLGRVVAMIPTEVVGIYFIGKGFAAQSPIITVGIWGLICWFLVPVFRIWGAEGPGILRNLLISMIAFPAWVFASEQPILNLQIDSATASIFVLLIATVGGLLYNDKVVEQSS